MRKRIATAVGRNKIFSQRRLVLAAVGHVLAALVLHVQADDAEEVVPEDTCIVEMSLPDGATVSVDGRDYGTNRTLTFRSLEPGKVYRSKLVVTFPGESEEDYVLLIRGGLRVPFAVYGPDKGRPELALQMGHNRAVRCVAFSPDGGRVLTGSDDNTAILWDTATGRQLRTFAGHADYVVAVAFSPDGRQAVTGSHDRTAILWDIATGRPLRSFEDHTHWVTSIAFSPDGRKVLTGSRDQTAILWDAETGKRLRTFAGHTDRIWSVAFSPDGRQVLTGSDDKTAILWKTDDGRKMRTFEGHPHAVTSVAFSSNGQHILTGSWVSILWDARTGQKLQTFGERYSVTFSPDGQRVLARSRKTAVLWDIAAQCWVQPLEGHTDSVSSVAFCPTGRHVLTGSQDMTAILWDADTGRRLRTFDGHGRVVGSLALSRDDRRVAAVHTGETTVDIWDGAVGLGPHLIDGNTDIIRSVAFSPDGQHIATASRDNRVLSWDAATGQKLQVFEEHTAPVLSVAYSGEGRRLLSGSQNGTTILWDVVTGKKLQTFVVPDSVVVSVAISPNGRQVATGSLSIHISTDDTLILWDTATGRRLHTLRGHTYPVVSVAFSPDGRHLLSGSADNTAVLWDVATGQRLRTFQGHVREVGSAVFSPDGRQVLTGSADGKAILWDTATGRRLRILEGHTSSVNHVVFSADGLRALTGSMDGTVRMWDIATGKEVIQLMRLRSNDWLVATPEGLFDGSLGGREKVAFRVGGGNHIVPVDRFFQDFYHPGLLAAIWRGERPLPNVRLGENMPPKITVVAPDADGKTEVREVVLQVEVEDQGGGIQGPWLMHNGARVLSPGKTERDGTRVRRQFQVTLVEGDNYLEVRAASADGSWESEPLRRILRYERPIPKSDLHLLAVGINRYADKAMALQFAVPDARGMARLFEERGKELYANVSVDLLLDEEATRSGITKAVASLAQRTRPQDTVAVFLAGHGLLVGGQYYFLPHDLDRQSEALEDDAVRQGLLAAELGDLLTSSPALRRMIVFDTGQSGPVLAWSKRARNPFAFRGAIERLSRSHGTFTLAASSVSPTAQEMPSLGHGMLTYTLLAGMHAVDSGPLQGAGITNDSDEHVAHVLQWFGFASTQVRELTKEYFDEAQDVQHGSAGTSFPVLPLAVGVQPRQVPPQQPRVDPREPSPEEESVRRPPEPSEPGGGPDLYVIAVGISRYAEQALSLRFARADALAMANLFRQRGAGLYGNIHVQEVLDGDATRTGILGAFEQAKQRARPEDVLVVFMSGHGFLVGQRYYFIPHDFKREKGSLEDDVRRLGLPADLLGDAAAEVRAVQRLLVFDTCASGGAMELAHDGADPFAFRGAIAELGKRQGVFVLAASAANEEAQEVDDLGHGVLTYALLAGLRAVPPGPLESRVLHPTDPTGAVDVLEWGSYASGQVPFLTKRYFGREQNIQMSGSGASFPLLMLVK